MKKKVLIFTILALLMPLSFSSCDDDRWEADLVGDYYCHNTGVFLRLRANGTGFMEDDYGADSFVWWAGKYTITFSFNGGGIETHDYRFTHDGLFIDSDFYIYADYGLYSKKKAAKKAEAKVEQQKAEAKE